MRAHTHTHTHTQYKYACSHTVRDKQLRGFSTNTDQTSAHIHCPDITSCMRHKLHKHMQHRSNYSTPYSLCLNPRLSDKDIIERDVPLGGTHWSSVPNPNMTSWIQMAKAGSWGVERRKVGGWMCVCVWGGGDKSISGDYIIHSSTSQHSNHRGESTPGRGRRRRRRRLKTNNKLPPLMPAGGVDECVCFKYL